MNDLRKLEAVSIATTTLAFLITIVLVTTGKAAEVNPVAAGLLDLGGWAFAGVLAITVEVATFEYLERRSKGFPRSTHAGGIIVAAVGVGDLLINVWLLSITGFPSLSSGYAELYAPAILLVSTFSGFVLSARLLEIRSALTRVPLPSFPSRSTIGIMAVVALVALSPVFPWLGAPFSQLSSVKVASAQPTVEDSISTNSTVRGVAYDEKRDTVYTAHQDYVEARENNGSSLKWNLSLGAGNPRAIEYIESKDLVYAVYQNGVYKISPNGQVTDSVSKSAYQADIADGGYVYFTDDNFASNVTALAPDLSQRWKKQMPNNTLTVAADRENNSVYVSTNGQTAPYEVYKMNDDNQNIVWEQPFDVKIRGLMVGNGNWYARSSGGGLDSTPEIWKYSSSGTELWSLNTSADTVYTGVMTFDKGTQTVYLTGDNYVRAIDPNSTLKFKQSVSETPFGIGVDPYGANSTIYYGEGSTLTRLDTGLASSASYGGFSSGQTVNGTVTDSNGETVSNATVEIVGVDKSNVTLEQGETYEEKANELIEKSTNPLPQSYDSDLQITGEGGVAQQASGEYVAIHRPEDWATKGWVDTVELGNPAVNPPAGEQITFSVWNPSMGEGALTIQNTVDDDLRGAVVNRTVVIEQLDPYGDVVDRQKLTANSNKRTGIGPGARDHPYVTTSLPPGVYRVYAEGDSQNAYTIVVGNTADLRQSFATDLENQAGANSKAAERIQELLNDGKFTRKTVTTNSTGHFNATVPADVGVVAVSAYKIDGKALTSMEEPTPQDMRAWVKNNDYNGSVYFSVEPRKFDTPTEDADVSVRKFSSPPYALLDSWASNWANYRDLLENGTLTELGTMYSVPLDEWNRSERETAAKDLVKIVDSNNQELIDAWEERTGEQWDTFREELEQSERTNRELREDIRSMEQTITSLQSDLKSEAADASIGDSKITFRQAFDGDFGKGDVIATWNDYDGSTTPIPDKYISVNKRPGQGDEIVVDGFPIPNSSAGGQVSVTVVSEDGEIGHGSEQVENPAFAGDVPELRSIDASTLRPGPGETVTLSPKFDSPGVSVSKVEVFDDSGSKISSSLSNGKAKFTPENSGVYFVRFTFNTTEGDSFVQSLRMPVEQSSHDWPASVHVRDGRLGTFAVAGSNVKDAKVTMQNSGGGISATALVDPDSGVNEVHYYLEGSPQAVEQDITTRVIEGRNIDTGTSISRHVGVYLHGREISDNAAVYRQGSGTDASRIPIPHEGETRGGELRQDEQGGTVIHSYTSSNGETTITIDNNPGRIEGWQYRLSLFLEERDVPFAVIVPDVDVANHLLELVDDAPGVGPDPTADLPSTGAIA